VAKKLYGLTEKDRKAVAELLRRGGVGRTSSRPVPTRRRVRDGGGGATQTLGILIADVPATTVTYTASSPWSKIDPGEAADAIIPVRRDGTEFKARLNEAEDDQVKVRAINPIWPEIIKAGTTTDADKPVVVVGYETRWPVTVGEETSDVDAFVITNVIYPVTILKGLADGASSGSSNVTVDGLSVVWGRNPGVSSVSAANPESWTIANNAYVLVIQKPDGTWLIIDHGC
jgi:hypothetical protein